MELLERQQFTPEGQELPAWLSYQAITTTINGVAVETGTILKLPLTYYGPSIPLGPDWTYGGETSPSGTVNDPLSTSSSVPSTTIPIASSASSSVVTSLNLPTVVSSSSSPTVALPSSTSISPSSLMLASTLSSIASGDATITSTSTITMVVFPTRSPAPSPVSPPDPSSSPFPDISLRTTLLALLPSILGPLILAVLIILLGIWYFRHRHTYVQASTADPTESIPIAPTRKVSSAQRIPFTPPRLKTGTFTEKAPLLSTTAEPEEGDITDYANPGPQSSILSRLSLGLGIAPSMRRISNGTAEKAYRTPSWALTTLAGIPRRISSGFRRPQSVPTGTTTVSHSTTQNDSGNGDSTDPQSAAIMGEDQLFYKKPEKTISSRSSSDSRSTRSRGIEASNWRSHFQILQEDGDDDVPLTPGNAAIEDAAKDLRGNTISVGVPETPRTHAGSIGSYLGMELGERDRRSRWVEEGDRMEFPVPPSIGHRDSMISNPSEYYSAPTSLRNDTPPQDPHQSSIRLIQPDLDDGEGISRPRRSVYSSRMSEEQRGSDNTRRSFVGEPLLALPGDLAEFGQLRSVSGGQINTLLSTQNPSNARSSHYASVHISDSSQSQYSHSSGGRSSEGNRNQTEQLSESGMIFGVVSDRALRGRRSHATIVSARSAINVGGDGQGSRPPVPEKSRSKPTALPRLVSGIETDMLEGIGGSEGKGGMDKVEKKKSWFGWKRDNI